MTNQGRTFPAEAYTTAEVEALMAACSPTSPTGKRNRALIAVLWRGALRCSEALELKVWDLNRGDGSIRILHPKGSKKRKNPTPPRTIGIEPRAWAVVEVWLAERERLGIPRPAPLFCTITAGRYHQLSPRYVRALMNELGVKADIGKRTHAHGLRHSRAYEAANERVPMHALSQFLGHSNVGTTDRYIQHLNPRAAIDAMTDSQWGRDSDG